MRVLKIVILILCMAFTTGVLAKKQSHHKVRHVASRHAAKHTAKRQSHGTLRPAASISTSELAGFDRYPRDVKKLITNALALSEQHLTYKFGSDNPRADGMDCSGTISYLLKQQDVDDVPRQADDIYKWAYKKGGFYAVNGHQLNSFEFSDMKPGDLLFWSGTYPVKRDPSITHVMMYLGKDKHNRPLMFGATSGRTYHGEPQSGVGVFDFTVPPEHSKARFLGYACIPHLTCA